MDYHLALDEQEEAAAKDATLRTIAEAVALAMGAPHERAAVLSWSRKETLPEADTSDGEHDFLMRDPYFYYEPPAPPMPPPRMRTGPYG